MASVDIHRASVNRPDENLGPMFLAISWTTVSLAAVFVALRLFVRCKTHANGWDDYLIYFAFVSAFIPQPVGSHTQLRIVIELIAADESLLLDPRHSTSQVRVRTTCGICSADVERSSNV